MSQAVFDVLIGTYELTVIFN